MKSGLMELSFLRKLSDEELRELESLLVSEEIKQLSRVIETPNGTNEDSEMYSMEKEIWDKINTNLQILQRHIGRVNYNKGNKQ